MKDPEFWTGRENARDASNGLKDYAKMIALIRISIKDVIGEKAASACSEYISARIGVSQGTETKSSAECLRESAGSTLEKHGVESGKAKDILTAIDSIIDEGMRIAEQQTAKHGRG